MFKALGAVLLFAAASATKCHTSGGSCGTSSCGGSSSCGVVSIGGDNGGVDIPGRCDPIPLPNVPTVPKPIDVPCVDFGTPVIKNPTVCLPSTGPKPPVIVTPGKPVGPVICVPDTPTAPVLQPIPGPPPGNPSGTGKAKRS